MSNILKYDLVLNEEKTDCGADTTKRRTIRIPSMVSRTNTITLDLMVGLYEESEETHIDTVGDAEVMAT